MGRLSQANRTKRQSQVLPQSKEGGNVAKFFTLSHALDDYVLRFTLNAF